MTPADQPTSNILELQDPNAFVCKVQGYAIGHHEMEILAISKNVKSQSFYIDFADVYCFSGPVAWRGANLRVAPQDEYLQFMRESMPVQHQTREELLDTTSFGELYVFEAEGCRIKIVAGAMRKRDK